MPNPSDIFLFLVLEMLEIFVFRSSWNTLLSWLLLSFSGTFLFIGQPALPACFVAHPSPRSPLGAVLVCCLRSLFYSESWHLLPLHFQSTFLAVPFDTPFECIVVISSTMHKTTKLFLSPWKLLFLMLLFLVKNGLLNRDNIGSHRFLPSGFLHLQFTWQSCQFYL